MSNPHLFCNDFEGMNIFELEQGLMAYCMTRILPKEKVDAFRVVMDTLQDEAIEFGRMLAGDSPRVFTDRTS